MTLSTPLIPVALAFGAGIALAGRLPLAVVWAISLAALMAAGLALALGRPIIATVALLLDVTTLGALRAAPLPWPPDHAARLELPRSAMLIGRLGDEPTVFAADRRRLDIALESVDETPRSGRVLVTLYGEPSALSAGQRVRLDVRLHRAAGFRNPGGFDYGRHLERQGVFVVGTGRADRMTVLDDPGPSWHVKIGRASCRERVYVLV